MTFRRLPGRFADLAPRVAIVLLLLLASLPRGAGAQEAPGATRNVPGRFFTITEPITKETIERVEDGARQLIREGATPDSRPVLVFEVRPGQSAPGSTEFYLAYGLETLISTKLGGARRTVAYVPEPLSGYAVLVALACDEIVMGEGASLGPISPPGQPASPDHREVVRFLANRKGRDPNLLLGMLDPNADLRLIRTADKQVHYLLASEVAEFAKTHQVTEDQPAWEGGLRGVLTAERAREEGFSPLIAGSRAEVARAHNLAGQAASDDPTLGKEVRPVWIRIDGPIDSVKESYLRRRIAQARAEGSNLIFFRINSAGGIDKAADDIADHIAGLRDMKSVAFIDDRALGVSSLIALACDEIVFREGAQMGDIRKLVADGRTEDLSDLQIRGLTKRAVSLAEQNGHPAAVARAMVDPEAVVLEAKDAKTGAVGAVLEGEVEADPGRYQVLGRRKEAGQVLTVTSDDVAPLGLGQVVRDQDEFQGLYGLRGKGIREDGPTWVDALVSTLTDPFVSWMLLFVGLFMLVVELKLPGIGLPAITSALAFLLFFWSHYLSGTADQLEIILFLVGMVCLALELFVFPGFGVFGMSGVLLILVSIVMASHTFVWPTQEYEYRQMGMTLLQVTVAMAAVGAGAVVLARYFPSIPLFNRLILMPEPWEGAASGETAGKPPAEAYDSLLFLIGETGRTTTVLRPSGRARFGDLLIDVTSSGFFIEPDSLVEVVDVQGSRVVVRKLGT